MSNKKVDKAFNAMVWIESLELDYKQGMGKLGSYEKGLCCLGLACYVNRLKFYDHWGMLPRKHMEALGLLGTTGDPISIINQEGLRSLSEYNDEEEWSFKQIAKHLKNNPHIYFIKEIAEEIKLAYS